MSSKYSPYSAPYRRFHCIIKIMKAYFGNANLLSAKFIIHRPFEKLFRYLIQQRNLLPNPVLSSISEEKKKVKIPHYRSCPTFSYLIKLRETSLENYIDIVRSFFFLLIPPIQNAKATRSDLSGSRRL